MHISLDNEIKQSKWHQSRQPLIYPVNKMIEQFSGDSEGEGFFFTLNQDLFVERYFSSTNTNLHHPYIDNKNNIWALKEGDFTADYNVIAPESPLQHPESLNVSKFHYIKLHGSFNWKRSDLTDMMVIGQDKERQIADEPLLTVYSDIFKKELRRGGVRLLVIGYNFGDKHINEVIADSLKNYGLKLVVVAPLQPEEFIQRLSKLSDHNLIERSHNYYLFGKQLSELFLPNDDDWRRIRDIIFYRHLQAP